MSIYSNATILWDLTPYSLVEVYRRFEVTYCLRLHGQRTNQTNIKQRLLAWHNLRF